VRNSFRRLFGGLESHDVSGARARLRPLEGHLTEASKAAIGAALIDEPQVVRALLFELCVAGRPPLAVVGCQFESESQSVMSEACRRATERAGALTTSGGARVGWIPLSGDLVASADRFGVEVYNRAEVAALGSVRIPGGHEVTVYRARRTAGIARTGSGVALVDFGPESLQSERFMRDVHRFLSFERPPSAIWVLQGDAASAFPMAPEPLQDWLRAIHELSRLDSQRADCFVVSSDTRPQRVLAHLLRALGKSLYGKGPTGELFVEIDRPADVVTGLPGPRCLPLPRDQWFVMEANQQKDRLSPQEVQARREIEMVERRGIRRVLADPPAIQWDPRAGGRRLDEVLGCN